MARTNFSFKKRQKELERQKKQEAKRQRRLAKKADASEEHNPDLTPNDSSPEPGSEADENPVPTP